MPTKPQEYEEKASKNEVFMEVKFDMAIQSFLERRGYENFTVEAMEQDDNLEFDFIQITHISYDRGRDLNDINLVDFQQILSAAASRGGKFAYLIDSDSQGIKLYLGISKIDNINVTENFLQDTFRGIYPGSHSKPLESNPFATSLQYSKAMLGVPSLKRDSSKSFKQSLEKIIFPLANKKFRILLVAESYERSSVQTIIGNLFGLGSEIHSFVKKSKNMQDSMADTKGTSESRTKGTSESYTDGTSESYAMSEGDSRADTQRSSKRGLLSSVLRFVPLPTGARVLISIFLNSTTNKTNSTTRTNSTSKSHTTSTNESQTLSTNDSKTATITMGVTYDEIDKSAEYVKGW